jgi:hypothetical protein
VSTKRLFHTLLDAAGLAVYEAADDHSVEIAAHSLLQTCRGEREPGAAVYSEAYAPEFALQVMEGRESALIERLHCRATHRAAYEGQYKLISIEGIDDRLFSLYADPLESQDVDSGTDEGRKQRLIEQLASFLEGARVRRPDPGVERAANLDDVIVQQRLRDLGYIE